MPDVNCGYLSFGGGGGGGLATDVFKIAKRLVTGVAKDDRIAVNSRDYTALTGGQDPEPVAGMVAMVGGGGGTCVEGIACATDKWRLAPAPLRR